MADSELSIPSICKIHDPHGLPEPSYHCQKKGPMRWEHEGSWVISDLNSKFIDGESANTDYPKLQVESFGLSILTFTSKVYKKDDKRFTTYVSSTPNTWKIQADVFHYSKDKQTDKFALISGLFDVSIKADSKKTILPKPLLELEEGNTNDLILELSGLRLSVEQNEVEFEDANKIFLGGTVLKQLTFLMRREHADGVTEHKLTLKNYEPSPRSSLDNELTFLISNSENTS